PIWKIPGTGAVLAGYLISDIPPRQPPTGEMLMSRALAVGLCSLLAVAALAASAPTAGSDPLPPTTTYRPLPTMPFSQARAIDEAQKPRVMERQRKMLAERYDLSDRPMQGVLMSGGRKAVQEGVRVRLPEGQTWEGLAQ